MFHAKAGNGRLALAGFLGNFADCQPVTNHAFDLFQERIFSGADFPAAAVHKPRLEWLRIRPE